MIQESQEILSEVAETQMVAADMLITELERGLEGYEGDVTADKINEGNPATNCSCSNNSTNRKKAY
jgi:hypothetical protein